MKNVPASLLRMAALALAILAPSAQAELSFDYRASAYFVTFADGMFNTANARYDVHVDVSGLDGDQALGYNPAVRTGQSNFSWMAGAYTGSSDAFLNVSNVTDPGTSGTATGDLALVGGARGAFDLGYDTAAGDLGPSFIRRNVGPAEYSLDFQGGGNGLISTGSLFVVVVFVQGDWTQHGTASGQLEMLTLNPAFTIVDGFTTYNAGLNATGFSAYGYSDGSAAFGPDLAFRLHGDVIPVPEPATAMMLGAGLLLVVLRRRSLN